MQINSIKLFFAENRNCQKKNHNARKRVLFLAEYISYEARKLLQK